MNRTDPLPLCPDPACGHRHGGRNGSHKGRKRYHCRRYGRYFGETEGTPMYRLQTPLQEIAHALGARQFASR